MIKTNSHSSINTYKTCPKKWAYHYGPQKRGFKLTEAMELGNFVHEAFAYSLQGNATIQECYNYLNTTVGEQSTLDKAREIIKYYAPLIGFGAGLSAYRREIKARVEKRIGKVGAEMWTYEQKYERFIEHRFEVDVMGITALGYIDAIIQDRYGNVVLVDWKTRGQLLDANQLALDNQLYLYVYVAREVLGIPVTKACQVQIKTTLPAKPKTIKSGALSKTLGITTRSVFIDELFRLGLAGQVDEKPYEHKFVDESEFLRMSYIDMGKVEQKTKEFVQWVKRLQFDNLMLPVNNAAICKWCQYTDLCLDNR